MPNLFDLSGRKALITGVDRINATTGDPCDWLRDNVTLVCELVPAGRGPAPPDVSTPGRYARVPVHS